MSDRLPATPQATGVPRLLPVAPGRRLNRRLNAQFWLWGQDIRNERGNLLIRFGCECNRKPEDCQGSSAYSWFDGETGFSLTLWGFGLSVWSAEYGRFFISRFAHLPRRVAFQQEMPAIWQEVQFGPMQELDPRFEAALALQVLIDVVAFIRRYECWVRESNLADLRAEMFAESRQRMSPGIDHEAEWSAIDQVLQLRRARV